MRKVVLLVVGLAVVLGGGWAGWDWWTVGRFLEATDNAYVEGEITVVSPKVAGYVRALPVVDNQRVEPGDVLAVIDDAEFRAMVAEAEAAVAAARAAIGSIDSRLVLQGSLIAEKEAAVDGAQADLKRARQDYDRFRDLLRDSHVSRQRFDEAEAELGKAEAALTRSRAALAAERDQLGVLNASRTEAEAKVTQALAALDLVRRDLADTVIRAPVAGVVGNRGARVGQYVRAGTPLLSVVPLPQVHVVANFKETQLAHMRPGQPAAVHVDAFPDTPIVGRIESFAPASGSQFSLLPPENATGNFTKVVQRVPVRIALPAGNPLAGLLRPGLSVEVSVDTRGSDGRRHLAEVPAGGVFGAVAPKVQTAEH